VNEFELEYAIRYDKGRISEVIVRDKRMKVYSVLVLSMILHLAESLLDPVLVYGVYLQIHFISFNGFTIY